MPKFSQYTLKHCEMTKIMGYKIVSYTMPVTISTWKTLAFPVGTEGYLKLWLEPHWHYSHCSGLRVYCNLSICKSILTSWLVSQLVPRWGHAVKGLACPSLKPFQFIWMRHKCWKLRYFIHFFGNMLVELYIILL